VAVADRLLGELDGVPRPLGQHRVRLDAARSERRGNASPLAAETAAGRGRIDDEPHLETLSDGGL